MAGSLFLISTSISSEAKISSRAQEQSDWLLYLTPSLMHYFYVLRSKKDNNLYFGYSSDLKKRFMEHNKGHVVSTADRRPLELVYYEAYKSENDARDRERQIKRRAKAFISLKRRLKCSIM